MSIRLSAFALALALLLGATTAQSFAKPWDGKGFPEPVTTTISPESQYGPSWDGAGFPPSGD